MRKKASKKLVEKLEREPTGAELHKAVVKRLKKRCADKEAAEEAHVALEAMPAAEKVAALLAMPDSNRATALLAMPAEDRATAMANMSPKERASSVTSMPRNQRRVILNELSAEDKDATMAAMSAEDVAALPGGNCNTGSMRRVIGMIVTPHLVHAADNWGSKALEQVRGCASLLS